MRQKLWTYRILAHPLWLVAVLALLGGAAAAETYKVGAIEIADPWTRATPKGASVGGAYMTITNKGSETDRLMSVSSPVAERAEVHQMTMDNGVMTMRPVQGGLEIKPGESVTLKPQSFHLMLLGLKQPLAQGERVKATLDFAKAGKIDLEYAIESIGAEGPSGAAAGGADHGAMGHVH
ncbi:MAG TPA: copper chaperone PCu(A)C [Xanthobacteraceae bacterium]